MQTEVQHHYDTLLAEAYSWMVGDFDTHKQRQFEFFRQQGLATQPPSLALDLGSGHGLQSVALAELGYQVVAIDLSSQLLAELGRRASCPLSLSRTICSTCAIMWPINRLTWCAAWAIRYRI